MTTATTTQNNRWQEITNIWKDNRWLYVVAGLLLGILVTPALEQITGNLNDLVGNLVPEAVGIVFTVLILERLTDNRVKEERKLNLFRQAKSRSNDAALEAVDQIVNEGWWYALLDHYRDNNGQIDLSQVQWANGAQLANVQLQGANLFRANFRAVDFHTANLHSADLVATNMKEGDLGYVNLQQADLRYSNLQEANLGSANLQGAYLDEINLEEAFLGSANLQQAKLVNANLQSANLYLANLKEANLVYANLQKALLRNANLRSVKDIETVDFDSETVLPDAEITRDGYGKEMRGADGEYIYTSESYWTPDTDMTRYTDPNHPDFWEPDWVKEARENGED